MPSLSPQEEQILVAGLQQGSKDSFRAFYDLYFIPLFYFAKGYVTNEQAAEDIATEAFIRLWNKHGDFDSAAKIKNFLYLAARNLAIDHLRREKRRHKRDAAFTDRMAEPAEETLRQAEITGTLFQHIYQEAEKLPEQIRLIFNMAYIEGLSNTAISERTGLSDQTVRNYKASALKTIRTALSGKDLFTLWLFISLQDHFLN